MQWFIRHALPSPDALSDPRIDMARRTDLSILPSTTLILAEIDPLRSGAEALGNALKRSGVELETSLYLGVTHGFFGLSRLVNKAMLAEAMVADRLRRAFKQNPVSLLRTG
jgi:acetyl esterase/lipase